MNSAKTFKKLLSLSLIIGSFSLLAKNESYSSADINPIINGSVVLAEDITFPTMDIPGGAWKSSFYNERVDGQIIFWIDHTTLQNQLTAFSASITVDIVYYTYDDQNDVFDQHTDNNVQLTVNYDPNNLTKGKVIYHQPGAHKIQATVTSTHAPVNPQLFLKAQVDVERYYSFDRNHYNAGNANTISTSFDGAANRVVISWAGITQAEEYDLEWIHINNYKENGTFINDPDVSEETFRNNASRISTKNNFYSIPLLFDRGFLLFRVRGKGRINGDYQRLYEGNWSSDPISFTKKSEFHANAVFPVDGTNEHEPDLNWNYQAIFTESGKNKYNVSYADGTSRVRQSVVHQNDQDESVVAETFYDHQGRPAIQSLPAPTNEQKIKFFQEFNMYDASTPYNKQHFDQDPGDCESPTSPFFTNTTEPSAGRYYSVNNTQKQLENEMYVPDAEGFPFTQTVYTPDKTGRVSAQTVAGADFKLGSTHENSFIYAIPFQEELDLLFGSDVGYAHKYKKNVSFDANGQATISFIDPNNNTIATALSGGGPTNLSPLPSYAQTFNTIDVDLLNKNRVSDNVGQLERFDYIEGIREFSRIIPITSPATPTFDYQIDGDRFVKYCEEEPQLTICYDCVVDVEISLTDNCGMEYLAGIDPGNPTATKIELGGPLTLSTDCANPIDPTTYHANSWSANNAHGGNIPLANGAYNLTKKVTIDHEQLDVYAEEYLSHGGCVRTKESFRLEELAKLQLSTDCGSNCDNCETVLGISYDVSNYNPTVDPNCDPCFTEELYNDLMRECLANCEETSEQCEMSYQILLADMSPGGQYGLYSNGSKPTVGDRFSNPDYKVEPEKFPLSVLNDGNFLPRRLLNEEGNTSVEHMLTPTWRNPVRVFDNGLVEDPSETYYLDSDGNRSRIYVNKQLDGTFEPEIISGTEKVDLNSGAYYVYPTQLKDVEDFINAWRPSWAKFLVPYHPEFGYYQYCVLIQASNDFDNKIIKEDNDLLQFDATLRTGITTSHLDANNLLNLDPFFNSNPYTASSSALKLAMKNRLNNYGNGSLNAWQLAWMLANCAVPQCTIPGNPNDCNIPAPGSSSLQIDNDSWTYFRSVYLSEKEKIMALQRHNKNAFEDYPGTVSGEKIIASYNECIGTNHFNFFKHGFIAIGAFTSVTIPINIVASPWAAFFNWLNINIFNTQFFNPGQPCNIATFHLYASKEKRFKDASSSDNIEASIREYCVITDYDHQTACADAKNNDVIAEAEKIADIERFKTCGQCPLAYDLELILDGIVDHPTYDFNQSPTPLYCEFPEFTDELNEAFTQVLHDNVLQPPSPNLVFEPSYNPDNSLTISLNDNGTLSQSCDIQLASLSAYGIDYGDIKEICCLIGIVDITTPEHDFEYTVTFDHPGTGLETEVTLTGTSCIDLFNCDFGNKCTLTDNGFHLMGLLNTLTMNDPGPPAVNKQLLSQASLEHGRYQYLLNENMVREIYSYNEDLNVTTPFLPELEYQYITPTSNALEAKLLGFDDQCTLKIEAVNGGTVNWTDIVRFYDIEADNETVSQNAFRIRAEYSGGNSVDLKGFIPCLTMKKCKPYVNEPSFRSNQKIAKGNCLPTDLFSEIEDDVMNSQSFSGRTGQSTTFNFTYLKNGSNVNCFYNVNIIENPYNDISQDVDAIGEISSVDEAYINDEGADDKFLARVTFSDQTVGMVEIVSLCGDVMDCDLFEANDRLATFDCDMLKPATRIPRDIEDYINDNKASMTVSPGTNYYVITDLIDGNSYRLHKGIQYVGTAINAGLQTETGTFGKTANDIPVDAMTEFSHMFLVENPNPNGYLMEAYVVFNTMTNGYIQFKLDALDEGSAFAKCGKCFRTNLITNGDFEDHNTVVNHIPSSLNYLDNIPLWGSLTPQDHVDYTVVTYSNYYEHILEASWLGGGTLPAMPGPKFNDNSFQERTIACYPYDYGQYTSINTKSLPSTTGNFLLFEYIDQVPAAGIEIWRQDVTTNDDTPYEFTMDAFKWVLAEQGCVPRYKIEISDAAGTTSRIYDDINNLLDKDLAKRTYGNTCTSPLSTEPRHKYNEGWSIDWSEIKLPYIADHATTTGTTTISIKIIDPIHLPGFINGNCQEFSVLGIDNLAFRETSCRRKEREYCHGYPPEIILDTVIQTCQERIEHAAEYAANILYQKYVDSIKQKFKEEYIEKCLNTYEEFTMQYTEGEHHYTLYYYDQSGNLVRTVPPKGVNKLGTSDLSDVREDRADDKKTLFTTHNMASTYAYNSLGQMLQQSIPDHDDLNIFEVDQYASSTSGIPANFKIRDIDFSNSTNGVAVGFEDVTNEGLTYYTKDGGKTWEEGNSFGVDDYNYISPGKHIVGDQGKLLSYDDVNSDWDKRETPTNEKLIYLYETGTPKELIIFSESGSSWITKDLGDTWELANNDLKNKSSGTIRTIKIDGTKGLAIDDKGKIFFTSNEGDLWSPRGSIYSGNLTTSMALDGKFISSGEHGSLIQYSGTSSTTDLNSGLFKNVHKLINTSDKDWFAISEDLFNPSIKTYSSSDDGGATWTNVPLSSSAEDIFFVSATEGYWLLEDEYRKTTDGGTSWSTGAGGSIGTGNTSIFVDGSDVFIGNDNGEYQHYTGTGSFSSLAKFRTNMHNEVKSMNIDLSNGRGMVFMGNKIYQSDGNGTSTDMSTWTWAEISGYATDVFFDIHYVSGTEAYAVSDRGKVIRTTDGGINWSTKANLNNDAAPFRTISFTSSGRGIHCRK